MSRDVQPSALPVIALGIFAAASILAAQTLPSLWLAVSLAVLALAGAVFIGLSASRRAALVDETAASAQSAAALAEAKLKGLQSALGESPLPLGLFGPDYAPRLVSRGFEALAPQAGSRSLKDTLRLDGGDLAGLFAQARAPREGTLGSRPVTATALPLPGEEGHFLLVLEDRSKALAAVAEAEARAKEFAEAAGSIVQLAQQLASASELMSASAEEQAGNSRRQKEQTDAVAASAETVSASIFDVAANASGASDATEEAREAAFSGVELVQRSLSGINAVAESARKLADVLRALDERAGRIGDVIGVINDIADQTNLLALNAAIEAARAGDAGRGFAVVADEVRKLAEKTMTATKEVAQAVREIQAGSSQAVSSMEQTAGRVAESTDISNQVGESLEHIKELVERAASRVRQIASASEAQAAAAEEIKASTGEMAEIARDAYEGADQQAQATKDLARYSQELLALSRRIGGQTARGETPRPAASGKGGLMKGILPKLMQEHLRQALGEKVYAAVHKDLGEPVFLPQESYPGDIIRQMAESAARHSGQPMKKLLYELGFHTPAQFAKYYRKYFKTDSFKDFLLAMNETHAQVTRDMPGVLPPRFTFEDKGDVLFMNYRSARGLFDYFEGILNGMAAHFKTRARITVKPLDAETARAEIRFG
ncbi:methyl-accepting chemotaxis sensory transducer with HNOB (heme) sensor [Alkalidesulfovibrio alkalitolerans DSM 16529]|uniref:Methyl-accepting chemotaxis sensory transducer with HNOB (Heme) sensor n=1 Tax=Alkalidesulfovibrio alkalitolerans DSM 16529 TaxID=1121439 RepID=S7UKZ4_9BACT|nr:methyl-accepting chemotaxis protein [Alkalidesulfovibrio alkalitolerans]EPR32993.1 methyl-accepting chemotaxis sensory transducer with HNOB (heme) sensor [Alkalidesulfovibrio alkalitolerans DSM 16529]